MIQLDQTPYPAGDDDQDLALGTSSHLAQFRRRGHEIDKEDSLLNGDSQLQINGNAALQINAVTSHSPEGSRSLEPAIKHGTKSASFLTLRYRSILGIVPMGRGGGCGGNDDNDISEVGFEQERRENAPQIGLEVAIIERPLWDVDLPPRFDGGQDWDT